MNQETTKKENVSRLHLATRGYIANIEALAHETEMDFTTDEKMRIMNAIRTIDPILRREGLAWNSLDRNNVETVLRQVAFLKVNPSAMPRECYFILRNVKDKDGSWTKDLEFGIEGAGNDAILRNFGVDVKEVKSYIVYDGDEFVAPYFDGWEVKLPKYQPKYKSKKAMFAVYLIKTTGGIQVSIAEREEVKQSLLAHIRQNGASEDLVRELSLIPLDDLLTKDEFVNKKIKNQYGKEVSLIGLAWTSAVSREAIVERKLRNLATRRFPKDFTHKSIELLYEETFEDEKYTTHKEIDVEEIVGEIETDFIESANIEEIPQEELNVSDDFEVVEETGEVIEPTITVETQETLTAEQKLQEDFKKHLAEKEKQEKEQKDLFDTQEQEKPDWL